MQLFLLGYIIISICEIFTIGGIPFSDGAVVRGFSGVHIATVVATTWVLMLNGAVGYQLIEDGTAKSMGLIIFSAALIFIGTGYIALATGFDGWSEGYFQTPLILNDPNRSYSLYTLYQLVPIIFLVVFFLLETALVLRILGERRPMRKHHHYSPK